MVQIGGFIPYIHHAFYEEWPIWIDNLPIQNDDFPWQTVTNYQRVVRESQKYVYIYN